MLLRFIGWSLGSAALFSLCAGIAAQQMYKHVDANGRVTFSDKPPSPSTGGKAEPVAQRAQTGSGGVPLPLELREAAERYPVTLFSGPNCEPCDAGRNLLVRRGVPFAERTVTSQADGEALRRLGGDQSLPLMTIGGQQVKGYSDIEWGQFLDAAGYPRSSLLPSAYRNPAPAPLVATQEPAAPAPPTQVATPAPVRPRPAAAQAPTVPAPEENQNPAGIKF
jgi:glutaredoxin